jgi:hypothetical protein
LDSYTLRKEHVINEAVRAGKFGESRREFWSSEYDRDPAGTERTLAALVPATAGTEPYPADLFPHLQRRHPQMRSATVAATAPITPAPPAPAEIEDEDVARWSRQLFPEVARAAAGAGRRRVVKCND